MTWKKIDGYHYEVSDTGLIRNIKTGKILVNYKSGRNGEYLKIRLCRPGGKDQYFVHRLVATEFIPNPENKCQVHHKNGNKHDNRAVNLEWLTTKEHAQLRVA